MIRITSVSTLKACEFRVTADHSDARSVFSPCIQSLTFRLETHIDSSDLYDQSCGSKLSKNVSRVSEFR